MLKRKPKGATRVKRGSSMASLLWMFVGAILTLMIGLFLYLWNPFDMGTNTVTTYQPPPVQPINQPNDAGNNYEFYDLLPEQQITNIPDAAITREVPQDTELYPDVVINAPEPEPLQDNQGQLDRDAQEYGISESTAMNPMQSQNSQRIEDRPQGERREQGNIGSTVGSATVNSEDIAIAQETNTNNAPNRGSLDNQPPSRSPTQNNESSRKNNSNTDNSNKDNGNDDSLANSSKNSTSTNKQRPAAGEATASIKPALPKLTYILQINSFGSAEEADKRRAQVLMAGVEAQVVKNKQPTGQVLYQVVSSPMTSRYAVITAQQKLQNNGIDSLIVEQRR